MFLNLNHSWLHGHYANGEINTHLDYVCVDDLDFYVQGQEAIAIIEEIHHIWVHSNIDQEEAFRIWVHSHL